MEECSRNFWIGEWQTEQLLPLFIAKTGCIESEITPLPQKPMNAASLRFEFQWRTHPSNGCPGKKIYRR